MIKVQSFSRGKTKDKNEDYFDYNESCFVLVDGTTDKSGSKYNGKTGGEIISKLVAREALSSVLTGVELVNFLNKKIYKLYQDLNITDKIVDPKYRFSGCCIVVRIIGTKIVVTYVGDAGFRINGSKIYKESKEIDINTAEKRAQYIKDTGDIVGSREYIMPLLLKQFEYQNNPDHPLGYGTIDGTNTPAKFVKIFEYPKDQIRLIELFSDGYFAVPTGTTIKDWENLFQKVEQEDPDKWKKYKSTKSKDDRTIAIIEF